MTFYVSREDYEPGLRYLERVLSPGQVFVDGGANLGIYTIVAAKLVGPQGQVLAFEPRPEAFTTLQCSVALNQLSNTKIFYKALSDHEGKFLLNSRETAVEVKEEMQVDTTTIDLALLDEGISQVDVLRLDVEGFEELVLRGAREMLRRHSPVILFSMSQAPERLRLASDGAWQLLKSLGYEFYTLGNHRELVELYTPRFGQTIAIKNQ
jgi:FkbM family methyltransferase